jgi:hypothetical protein
MGLSDDQRAMLRLVAQRGEQGYEDVAALKKLSVEEVRAQVAAALAQLDDEGALSGSGPVAQPPAAASEPEEPPPAPPPVKEPAPPPAPPRPPRPSASVKPPRKKPSLPSGAGLRAAIAGVVIVIALIVIVVLVSGGGDDGDSSTGSSSGAQTTAVNEAANGKQVTKAILAPVDGSKAKGIVVFAKVGNGNKARLAMEIAAQGLEPTTKSSAYTLWVAQSPSRMLPFLSVEVDKSGTIAGQYEPPIEILGYLASETFTDLVLTKTNTAELEAAVKQAAKAKQTPAYTGEAVLSGTVTGPVVGAQVRQEEKEKGE